MHDGGFTLTDQLKPPSQFRRKNLRRTPNLNSMVDALQNSKILILTSGGEDGGDRFSNLPEPIIHYIFSFLETIDVVRASAVSRKWRYLWLSTPYLNFDINTTWPKPHEEWSFQTMHEKFKDFVNWILLSQNGSVNIQRFRLSYLSRADDYTLYRWFSAMARRNVQVLDLNINSRVPIELPYCLLTCESLVSLKLDLGWHLHRGVLKLPTSAGFSRLKSLDLETVELLDYISFRKFISSCPLLENLTLERCTLRDFKILDISSASLKYMNLDENQFVGSNADDLGNCEVKIACPNLVSFNCYAQVSPNFSFEDLNSLQNAFTFLDEFDNRERVKESCHLLSKILNGVCHIKVMKLSPALLQFIPLVLQEPASSFNNLKSLILCVTMAEWAVPSIISLLNCSPHLEALTIYFDWEEYYNYWKISDKAISCLTYHLKSVELIHFSGCRNELELVRFLRKNGHALQKMSISLLEGVKICEKMISLVMEFHRSSSSVALKFLEPKPVLDFSKLLR